MQPFTNEDKKIYLLFNGEIYNYLEIKNELQSLEVPFTSESDTEVLYQSYLKWGL